MLMSDLQTIMEDLAPARLARMGDEPGWQGTHRDDVTRLAVCVDTTPSNLREAANQGVDTIIAHHGWDGSLPDVVREKKIAIYRCHTCWDRAPEGNSVVLARRLHLSRIEAFNYSAVGDCPPTPARRVLTLAGTIVGREMIPYMGNPEQIITRVGVMAGACFGPNFPDEWAELGRRGAEMVLSGDLTQRVASAFVERGIFVGDIGHSCSELPGMEHMADLLRERVKIPVAVLRGVYGLNMAAVSGR